VREYTSMHKTILTILSVAIVLVLAGYLAFRTGEAPVVAPIINDEQPALLRYAAPEYGLAFDYSPGYYLKERKEGPGNRPELVVVLVEDTQDNRDVIEGRVTEGREGPPSITIEVHPNPDRLPAHDWVRADTNWTVRTSEAAPVGRGQITGVTYSWDGLYSGKSVIVTKGERAYVFSVTWLTPEDRLLAEFDRILASVELTD